MNIPLGFRFNPTDEELIRCFLYVKVTGFELPWDGVIERRVYDAEPWTVFSDADDVRYSYYWHTKKEGGSMKKTTYVFTSITNKNNSKRAARVAGCGTWSGQTGPKDITHDDTGETIGYSRMLTFKKNRKDSDSGKKIGGGEGEGEDVLGHWIMHEYSLSDSTLRMAGLTHTDTVLCKITRIIKNNNNNHNKQTTPTFQDHHPLQIQTADAAEAVQYYSPEGGESSYSCTTTTTTFEDHHPQIQIDQQTAGAVEAVQYYSSEKENNIYYSSEGESSYSCTAPFEDEDDHHPQIRIQFQQTETADAVEEVQYYSPPPERENNTAAAAAGHSPLNNKRSREILEMQQQQQQQQQGCKKQKSWTTFTDEFVNAYDLPYEDFADIDIATLI